MNNEELYVKIDIENNKEELSKIIKEIREVIRKFRANIIQYTEAMDILINIKHKYTEPVLLMAIFHISFVESVMEDKVKIDYDKILF